VRIDVDGSSRAVALTKNDELYDEAYNDRAFSSLLLIADLANGEYMP
jgi:hypothetical protein